MFTNPFGRALRAIEAMTAALLTGDTSRIAAAKMQASAYRSRGHGFVYAGNKRSHHRVAMDKRAARKLRNRRGR